MEVLEKVSQTHAEMAEWRHDIHAHPETAFERASHLRLSGAKTRSFSASACTVAWGVQAWWARSRQVRAGAPSACARTWTHCIFMKKTPSATARSMREKCTPAATTDIPPCCSAPRNIWPRPRTSMARCISSSSRPRKTKAADGKWSSRACLKSFPATRCMACTTGPG